MSPRQTTSATMKLFGFDRNETLFGIGSPLVLVCMCSKLQRVLALIEWEVFDTGPFTEKNTYIHTHAIGPFILRLGTAQNQSVIFYFDV